MELKTLSTIKNIAQLNEDGLLFGYASVFDNTDNHNDIILKGAFKNIDISKIKILWQHDPKIPIGSILSLKEDDFGLKVEIALDLNVRKAREAFSLVKSNAISGLSIGFNPLDYDYNLEGKRILKKIDLWEISLVTFPSNSYANIISTKHLAPLKILTDSITRANQILNELSK